MEKIMLVATGNKHKMQEIAAIFARQGLNGWQFRSLADYPDYIAPEEDGDSFSANAAIKAVAAARMSGLLTLADDSGLCVDALDGAPGIYSARYAGEGHDDAANRRKLLEQMQQVPPAERGAAFVCAVALAFPDGEGDVAVWSGEGRCPGAIHHCEQGENGFGYDNLFWLYEHGCTMAEISEEEKNSLSHRFLALEKAARLLQKLSEDE